MGYANNSTRTAQRSLCGIHNPKPTTARGIRRAAKRAAEIANKTSSETPTNK